MNQTDNSFWERATRIPTQDTLADPDIISQMDMPTSRPAFGPYPRQRQQRVPQQGRHQAKRPVGERRGAGVDDRTLAQARTRTKRRTVSHE